MADVTQAVMQAIEGSGSKTAEFGGGGAKSGKKVTPK